MTLPKYFHYNNVHIFQISISCMVINSFCVYFSSPNCCPVITRDTCSCRSSSLLSVLVAACLSYRCISPWPAVYLALSCPLLAAGTHQSLCGGSFPLRTLEQQEVWGRFINKWKKCVGGQTWFLLNARHVHRKSIIVHVDSPCMALRSTYISKVDNL